MTTDSVLEAAERDELVTRREDFPEWRKNILACATGNHRPVKRSKWDEGLFTCECEKRIFLSDGEHEVSK